jgi:hypothetical protein
MPPGKSSLREVAAETEIAEPAAPELLNWLPVDAVLVNERPCVRWIEWPDASFAEPFFAQTVARALKDRAGARRLVTGIEALIQLEQLCDSVQPSGFIFHGSRCGSTWLANACRGLDGAIVISEAEIVEKIVSRFFSYPDDRSAQSVFNASLLRAALRALGQRRRETEQKLFVKFSALSTLQFRWIKRIWPRVPGIFMFRDPLEVIASNVDNPPEWLDLESTPEQSTAVTGLEPEAALQLDLDERCARALGRFYEAGAELAATGALLIDYDNLSAAELLRAIEFLGFTPSAGERDRIVNGSQFYSKDSSGVRKFEPDSSQKRSGATARMREVAELWATKPYLHLRSVANTEV